MQTCGRERKGLVTERERERERERSVLRSVDGIRR